MTSLYQEINQKLNEKFGGERGAYAAKGIGNILAGNLPGALYSGYKFLTTPQDPRQSWQKYWNKNPIEKTGQFDMFGGLQVPDLQNQITAAAGGLYARPAALPGMGEYGTTVQDVQNTITPTGGIQQPGQEAPPVQAPPVQQPKIQPKTMPMPSDLEFIYGAKDSAYQSLIPPALQTPTNPMTANGGFFDMNKAGTVGGQYIQGVGWMTDAARAAGLKPEDLEFQAMMQQRIANMYQ